MIALILWVSGSIICFLLYIIMRQNWRINALEDQLEAQANTLIGYDKTLHDYNDSCNFEPK